MIGRKSLGPVFTYDMITRARRWQDYAGRAVFVLSLLIGMAIAWSSYSRIARPVGTTPTIAQLARIGEGFFYAVAGIQTSFILLAAPAAAAGSICIDRARGTLLHMMVTDLSDAEIVLGRLGSRLAPVFGLVGSVVPVLAVAGLLGGIDFGALVGLFIVSIALAVLGCSLALAISIKASKTHEVLMAVYLALGFWLLSVPIWWITFRGTTLATPPGWFQKTNPYVLVYAPYAKPGFAGPIDYAIFFVAALAVSAGLVAWSISRLRRSVVESSGRSERLNRRVGWISRLLPSLPGPTLDGNPVLWREWHRNQPSRLARWLWLVLLSVSWALVAWGFYTTIAEGVSQNGSGIQIGYMILVFFGLLMVAATSATVLAEERTRGSLDILLSTPLSTRSIVLAKWWGAYRTVLGLALMPLFVSIFLAAASPDVPVYATTIRWGQSLVPLTLADRIQATACIMVDFLTSGALVVSIGVLLATWISRIGRAVGTSVVIFAILGIGWPIASEMILSSAPVQRLLGSWYYNDPWFRQSILCLSPPFGTITALENLSGIAFQSRAKLWNYLIVVILIKMVGAGFLLGLTILTFNRCLGRVVETRSPAYRPPRGPIAHRSSPRHPLPISVTDSPSPLP